MTNIKFEELTVDELVQTKGGDGFQIVIDNKGSFDLYAPSIVWKNYLASISELSKDKGPNFVVDLF